MDDSCHVENQCHRAVAEDCCSRNTLDMAVVGFQGLDDHLLLAEQVVDGVSDVVDVNTAEVKPAPELGSRAATDYIRGLVSVSDRMVVLLDIDRLIATDMTSFSGNTAQGESSLVAPAA